MTLTRHLLDQPAGCLPRVTEDDGLADGDHAVDVGNASVLGFGCVTVDIVLFNVIH